MALNFDDQQNINHTELRTNFSSPLFPRHSRFQSRSIFLVPPPKQPDRLPNCSLDGTDWITNKLTPSHPIENKMTEGSKVTHNPGYFNTSTL